MLSANVGRSQGIRRMLSAFTKNYNYFVGHCRSNKALLKCVYMQQQSGCSLKGERWYRRIALWNWCGWPKQVSIVCRVPVVGGWGKGKKRCERFGLEGPAIRWAFRDYVDEPSSSPHRISQSKSIDSSTPYQCRLADSECECSTMNAITTKTRNRLLVKTISTQYAWS